MKRWLLSEDVGEWGGECSDCEGPPVSDFPTGRGGVRSIIYERFVNRLKAFKPS